MQFNGLCREMGPVAADKGEVTAPPAPGIFHARTPSMEPYRSIYSGTPGWTMAGNIATWASKEAL